MKSAGKIKLTQAGVVIDRVIDAVEVELINTEFNGRFKTEIHGENMELKKQTNQKDSI